MMACLCRWASVPWGPSVALVCADLAAGEIATRYAPGDDLAFAGDLVTLIKGFRSADTKGRLFSSSGRGGTLTSHDVWMEKCFRGRESHLDVRRFRALWWELRELPRAGL